MQPGMGRAAVVGGGRSARGLAAARPRQARAATRVLIVDDVLAVREGLAVLLRGAGYDVVTVESGPAALAELDRNGVDLLLTDLAMPEMTGWDLVRAVRARGQRDGRGRPLCIGLYSALLSALPRERLARAQVDFAITKPSDPETILDAVERALAWAAV